MSGPVPLPSSAADIMPPDLTAELETVAGRVRERLGNLTANVIEIGRELQAVKGRLQHGQFVRWVETACGLSRRMAQLMMKAARWAEGKSETVTLLEPTTIYLLAAPSTPKTVAEAVLSRADEGEVIPPHIVKDMIRAEKTNRLRASEKNIRLGSNTEECDVLPEGSQSELEPAADIQILSNNDSGGAEQGTVTDQLIEMLVAWPRFLVFSALLRKVDVSNLAQALKHVCERSSTNVVTKEPMAKGLEQSPLASLDGAIDTPTENGVKASADEVLSVPGGSPGASAEDLMAILETLKVNTQLCARQWIRDGCPSTSRRREHHVITEKLKPFRAATSTANEAERLRFLEISASPSLTVQQ